MKENILSMFSLLLAVVMASCSNQMEELNSEVSDSYEQQIAENEKAIQTFNDFVNRLNENGAARSIISGAEVIAVKKTTTVTYGGIPQARSNNIGLPVYELTLENPDKTLGFAVVADAVSMDEVIAYSPVGAIADTVYNKALASYFRDLSMLSDIASERAIARADYWQPGWDEFRAFVLGPEEFVRWLTPSESANRPNQGYSWIYYGPTDKMEIINAYVPTQWGQGNPYNNRVPYYVDGTRNKVSVGCYAVAAGQIMAFHKYPSTYDWGMLTMGSMIDPTPMQIGGGIDLNKETAIQKEVSRLLTDLATAGETEYDTAPDKNSGSTYGSKAIPGLNRMGYVASRIYLGQEGGSASIIKDEIKNYNRPVIYSAYSDIEGHMWVIDAILTLERWEYCTFWSTDGVSTKEGLKRLRAQSNLMHCNWGWNGKSDGWYYNFNPPYKDGYIKFYRDKYIYTGIKPQ